MKDFLEGLDKEFDDGKLNCYLSIFEEQEIRISHLTKLSDSEYILMVISEFEARRHLFVYGLTTFETEVSLTMMDFRNTHRIFEVDHFSLPRDWIEIPNFVYLYESLITWALCVNETRNGLIEQRKKRRITRCSEARIAKRLALPK
ncbi:2600_t:CDS:2 [Funneliformis mosseae]|uniref:2600_t:CDS:1 n=1 Tax=Funneliformis mosseae TaxID=27381 RepID=A0A9N9B6Z8_FUNMO|nr:2600_t:CDS:2 [Funneliformis mosseae]